MHVFPTLLTLHMIVPAHLIRKALEFPHQKEIPDLYHSEVRVRVCHSNDKSLYLVSLHRDLVTYSSPRQTVNSWQR